MQQKWKLLNWLFQARVCSHIELRSESGLSQLMWTNGTGAKEGKSHKRSVKSPVQTLIIRHPHDLEGDSDIGNAAVLPDGNKIRTAMFWFIQKFIYQPCQNWAYLGLCLISESSVWSWAQFNLTTVFWRPDTNTTRHNPTSLSQSATLTHHEYKIKSPNAQVGLHF